MAEIIVAPKIRCDNCGTTVDKEPNGTVPPISYSKPRRWGSLQIVSGRGQQGYPGEFLKFTDLCPSCAMGAHDAAAAKLAELRGEAKGES